MVPRIFTREYVTEKAPPPTRRGKMHNRTQRRGPQASCRRSCDVAAGHLGGAHAAGAPVSAVYIKSWIKPTMVQTICWH